MKKPATPAGFSIWRKENPVTAALALVTDLTCFQSTRPIASANESITLATRVKNSTANAATQFRGPSATHLFSKPGRYRKKRVTVQLHQNKAQPEPPPRGGAGLSGNPSHHLLCRLPPEIQPPPAGLRSRRSTSYTCRDRSNEQSNEQNG